MPAKQNTDNVLAREFTVVTASAVTDITLLAMGDVVVWVKATVGSAPLAYDPTLTFSQNVSGFYPLNPGDGITGALENLFPGVPGADHVQAICEKYLGKVVVSHA